MKITFLFIIFLTLSIKLIINSIILLINYSFFDVINLLLMLIKFIVIQLINKTIVEQNNKINDNYEIYFIKKMNR